MIDKRFGKANFIYVLVHCIAIIVFHLYYVIQSNQQLNGLILLISIVLGVVTVFMWESRKLNLVEVEWLKNDAAYSSFFLRLSSILLVGPVSYFVKNQTLVMDSTSTFTVYLAVISLATSVFFLGKELVSLAR
jgi:hypothetical protein